MMTVDQIAAADRKLLDKRWEALFDNVSREDVTAWRDNFVTALRAQPEP